LIFYNVIYLKKSKYLEKERVKQLIDHAMKGLEQSGRIIEKKEENTKSHDQASIASLENALQKLFE
jgi:hypothetical protein